MSGVLVFGDESLKLLYKVKAIKKGIKDLFLQTFSSQATPHIRQMTRQEKEL